MLPQSFFAMTAEQRYEFLRRTLQSDCEVTFTKVDGSVRSMPCTLRADALPPMPVTESNQRTRSYNPEVLSVWCLDKKEWRSFRVMNVTKVVPL